LNSINKELEKLMASKMLLSLKLCRILYSLDSNQTLLRYSNLFIVKEGRRMDLKFWYSIIVASSEIEWFDSYEENSRVLWFILLFLRVKEICVRKVSWRIGGIRFKVPKLEIKFWIKLRNFLPIIFFINFGRRYSLNFFPICSNL